MLAVPEMNRAMLPSPMSASAARENVGERGP
jgi:hypothetical protein